MAARRSSRGRKMGAKHGVAAVPKLGIAFRPSNRRSGVMRRSTIHPLLVCLPAAVVVVGLDAGLAPAGAQALVSVGSPIDHHPQNAQNEPALAVDASRPNILAAGANDLVDMQP